MDKHSIVLGGGCFWCIEAAFTPLKGILSAVSGYSGGEAELADYQSVCTGQTGHAEVVRLEWDPDIIQLSEILLATA